MLKKLQKWKRGTSLSLSLNCFQDGMKTKSATANKLWLIQIWKWNNCVSIYGKLKNFFLNFAIFHCTGQLCTGKRLASNFSKVLTSQLYFAPTSNGHCATKPGFSSYPLPYSKINMHNCPCSTTTSTGIVDGHDQNSHGHDQNTLPLEKLRHN